MVTQQRFIIHKYTVYFQWTFNLVCLKYENNHDIKNEKLYDMTLNFEKHIE